MTEQEKINCLKSMKSGIKKERNLLKLKNFLTEEEKADIEICSMQIDSLETAISALTSDKNIEWIYSDLLRVKHGTMRIDSLIDKVYADMRGTK
jgi:hypothetical protein